MNTKTKITLITSFIVVILLFLLFTSMIITGALSNGGMMGSQRMAGISWMWIPAVLTLGLALMLGWNIFSGKTRDIVK